MSAASRNRSFVVVVAASATTLAAATAAANPPAPSSLPDPLKLTSLKPGETPHRLRRHDSGCYLYGTDGPVAKTECVKGIERSGEEIEREVESGQCVLIEPWNGEPKETECPPVLVPAGYVAPAKKGAPKPAAVTAPSAPTETRSGCSKCGMSTCSTSGESSLLAAAVIGLAIVRRSRRASPGSRRRS